MTGPSDRASVHLLTVTLQQMKPPVRRLLEVPSMVTLGELDAVLMAAFDWGHGHLHQFEVGEAVYGPREPVDVGFLGSFHRRAVRDENAVVLGRLLPRPGGVVVWTYDLGDDWRHRIEVTAVQPADPETIYPRCTGGSGLAPEEDTGRERRGTFGVVQRERLNAVLQRLLGRRGQDLQADEPAPDEVFSGLFPEIDMTSAGPGCDCEECEGADGEAGAPTMPVLRTLPDDELAAAAAATPLVSRAVALAGWLGAGRPLTPSKVLRPAEADEAVAQLGLDRPLLPPHRDAGTQPFGRSGGGGRKRSAKDQPALHAIWHAALAAGLIEIRGQKARPGPELAVWQEPAEPGRRLENWAQLLAGYLRTHAEAERADRNWYVGPSHALLPSSAMMLYTSVEAPLWPGILAVGDILFVEEDVDPLMLLALPETAARWADVLERWAVTGAVVASDDQAPGELGVPIEEGIAQAMAEVGEALGAQDGGVTGAGTLMEPALHALRKGPFVEVTLFGRSCLARVLRAHGLSVPTLGDLVDTPPGELLQALYQHDPAAAVEEARGWLDARGWPDARGDAGVEAVRDVVRSAAVTDEAGPVRRSVLPVIVGLVAEAAEPLLDEWQADPLLAASVAIGRFGAGKGPEPTVGQFLWLAVDALSMVLDDDEDFAELAGQLHVEAMLAEPGGVAAAQRLDHPRTREVLHRLVRHLDDRRLAGRLRAAVRGGHLG